MKRGGARKGAGRKRGVKEPATLEREAVLRAYRQRVMGMADDLLNQQLLAAKAQYSLFKIIKKYPMKLNKKTKRKVKDKSQKLIHSNAILVKSEKEIENYLTGKYPVIDIDEEGVTYFPKMTREPNAVVLNQILDRTFGKAVAPVAFTDPEGNTIPEEKRKKSQDAIGSFLSNKKNGGNQDTKDTK